VIHKAACLIAGDDIKVDRNRLDRVIVIQFATREGLSEAVRTGRCEFTFGWPEEEKPKPRPTPTLPGMGEA
jgi:hypothetical protein